MSKIRFQSFIIDEPELTFGEGKRFIDPKMGLLAYGPCLYKTRRAISSSIRLGIIGSNETIQLVEGWIEKCHTEIPGKGNLPQLFQAFSGFTRIFGSELYVLPECKEELSEEEINQVTSSGNRDERINNTTRLILSKLYNFKTREPKPQVVIIALPQKIVDMCGVKKLGYAEALGQPSKREKQIVELVKEQVSEEEELETLEEDFLETTPEMYNLRRMIKAEAMVYGIPTQMAKPTAFTGGSKDESIQDEATRAWNFCVALYYKAEGYPWKLADMPIGTCYVGITFYEVRTSEGNYRRASLAQIFTHTGEGLVLKGGRADYDPKTKSPHLPKENAQNLLTGVLKLYREQMKSKPTRLVIHKSSTFSAGEREGFKESAKDIKEIDMVAIQTRGVRFMQEVGTYPPKRGSVIQIANKDYIIFTKGWIPFQGTYAGLRVPVPIEILEHYGPSTIETVCKEILALTKMNWNSTDFCIREPVTLAYAREVGKILAYVPEEVAEPRPEYRFYM